MDHFVERVRTICIANRYQLVRLIGSGTFGKIYLGLRNHVIGNSALLMNIGRDTTNNDEIAIKLEHYSVDPSFLAGEVHLYRILKHRNGFSRVFWYGQQDDFRIMVFQLLGPSLGDLLHYCGGRFSLKTILLLFDQLLHRLKDMHKAGYIHRDIKPENFLLGLGREGNTVYMTDLGLASPCLSQPVSQTASLDPARQHRLVGTCQYASIKAHMDAGKVAT